MALHEQAVGATDEWYTPQKVFDALYCCFDLDVASPHERNHTCVPADHFYDCGGLEKDWTGFVWMNPPFGGRNGMVPWLDKFFEHGDGVALAADRTSAPWWHSAVRKADAVLFVAGKLQFIGADGKPGKSPAQGTCLLASGNQGVSALLNAEANGLGICWDKQR